MDWFSSWGGAGCRRQRHSSSGQEPPPIAAFNIAFRPGAMGGGRRVDLQPVNPITCCPSAKRRQSPSVRDRIGESMTSQRRRDGDDLVAALTARMRDSSATILICWFIAAIVVAGSLVLCGADGKTATVANPSRHADASPVDRRLACLDARLVEDHRGWRV